VAAKHVRDPATLGLPLLDRVDATVTVPWKGDAEMDAVQHELLERYAELYCEVLAPCTKVSRRELKRRCVAIIGAAEALAREMLLEQLEEETAASTLRSLIVAWLE
jgi:hypothetical protein